MTDQELSTISDPDNQDNNFDNEKDVPINEQIQGLISQFEKEKSEPISIVIAPEEGEEIQIKEYQESTANNQLQSSVRGLQNWAQDPYNCNMQEYGKALEILTKVSLKKIFRSSLVVKYTPAELDYLLNKDQRPVQANYSSVDIMVGTNEKKGFNPLLFVNTSLSKYQKPFLHQLFKAPVVTITGREYLNRAEDIILQNFSQTTDVEKFIKETNYFYGPRLVDEIFKDLRAIEIENFELMHKEGNPLMPKVDAIEGILANYKLR